jgi:predicted DNA-binding transcriptional regulator AlpA
VRSPVDKGPGADDEVVSSKTGPSLRAKPTTTRTERLLTPKEAADALRVSLSWLAKARMRGDGPAFVRVGRSIRYTEAALLQWIRARQRLSTSDG